MSTCFYIGTRERMLEVRAPSVTIPSSKTGWSSELPFLNGGTSLRRSTAAHKRYEMTWNLLDRDEARKILDLADRLYGTGNIYFHDPLTADRNVLPQWWASPFQGLYDGLPLNGGNDRGAIVATPPNSLDFPVQSIRYDTAGLSSRSVWVPIPPGHTAHIGAYGANGTGGTVVATPTISATANGTPITLTLMDVTSDSSRFNESVAASSGVNGVTISLGGSGTLTLNGLMVQVLKDGVAPQPGGFISGQGNSGCQFVSQPEYTPYSAALDQVGVTAELIETGGWSQ